MPTHNKAQPGACNFPAGWERSCPGKKRRLSTQNPELIGNPWLLLQPPRCQIKRSPCRATCRCCAWPRSGPALAPLAPWHGPGRWRTRGWRLRAPAPGTPKMAAGGEGLGETPQREFTSPRVLIKYKIALYSHHFRPWEGGWPYGYCRNTE